MKLYIIKIFTLKFNRYKIVNNKNQVNFPVWKPRNISNQVNRAKNRLRGQYIFKKTVIKKKITLRTYFKIFLHFPRHLNYIQAQTLILFKLKIKTTFKFKIRVFLRSKIKLTNIVTNLICLVLNKISLASIKQLNLVKINNKINLIKKVEKMLLLASFKLKKWAIIYQVICGKALRT